MYCLNKKRYVSTAVAATQYGSSIQNKSKAKTIFSIAKLSSKLSLDAAPMKALRFLDEANNYKDKFGSPKRSSPRQVLSARERDERNSVRHLNVILKEMDSNLAVIHTQELLTELCYE